MTSDAKPATKPNPADIRRARTDNPKMRERDLAAQLGISEADLVAAHVGEGARRIEPRLADLLNGLAAVGEVMALTRNESAVHEKIGVYDKPVVGERASMMLGADIDLRIFPAAWAHGFAVEARRRRGPSQPPVLRSGRRGGPQDPSAPQIEPLRLSEAGGRTALARPVAGHRDGSG